MEPIAAELLAELGATCAAVRREFPAARLLAAWDFDGTLLRGDCSEGLTIGGRQVYPGLVELAIGQGLAAAYPPEGGFAACWQDYRWLESHIGAWLAYPFLAQIFAGAPESALDQLARRHFAGVLDAHYFVAARQIFSGLAELGVEQHIISASAQVFVRGAEAGLGLPARQIHGIRVQVESGVLTRLLLAPVTCADGKRLQLLAIVRAAESADPVRPVFVVAGFGNSHDTDGPMLAHVAAQRLPAGRALAVMINAGQPPGAEPSGFRSVQFGRTVGDE